MIKSQADDLWAKALAGDKDAFERLVEPHLEELRDAARHELTYLVSVGDLDANLLTPEELVGEVLMRAWRTRRRKPAELGLAAWLHGLIFRVADAIVARQKQLASLPTVSLEERVPDPPLYDDEESFYEWYQPDDLTRYEDVLPDVLPTPEQVIATVEAAPAALSSEARRMLMLEARGVPLRQIAVVMGRSVRETREALVAARRTVRQTGQTDSGGESS